jgi:hypothetical protein
MSESRKRRNRQGLAQQLVRTVAHHTLTYEKTRWFRAQSNVSGNVGFLDSRRLPASRTGTCVSSVPDFVEREPAAGGVAGEGLVAAAVADLEGVQGGAGVRPSNSPLDSVFLVQL